MHRSRICYVTIDCHDLERVARFWADALGAEFDSVDPNSVEVYARLKSALGQVTLLFQCVPEDKAVKNRVHLDFESDDVEAEVARLEGLGAIRISREEERGYWFWVMADPEGNEFCVLNTVYPQLLAETGAVWEDAA